jgi:hypothetical protein
MGSMTLQSTSALWRDLEAIATQGIGIGDRMGSFTPGRTASCVGESKESGTAGQDRPSRLMAVTQPSDPQKGTQAKCWASRKEGNVTETVGQMTKEEFKSKIAFAYLLHCLGESQ